MDEVLVSHQRTALPSAPLSGRRKLVLSLGSLCLSLAAAEFLASTVHRGAFPFLNIFQADARYGVRLMANATTRVRSRDGHLTDIRTNSLGFRGPEWPKPVDWPAAENAAPSENVPSGRSNSAAAPQPSPADPFGLGERVLILGDSQMFGYGVPYSESTSAHLETVLGRNSRVLNASVPSWGPSEYLLALSEWVPLHRPRYVLFVANAANDWFETVPNIRRTTARDGWAARAGTPEESWFPFRSFLLGRSHLVLAIRQLARHLGDPELPPAVAALRLKKDIAQLRPRHRPEGFRSPLTPSLRTASDACAKLSCQLVAVALPLDVQVDSSEWRKYRVPPEDLAMTEAILEDFIADAQDLRIRAVSLLPSLRYAEPGAFLPDDYHLSPRGHRAVADAIARALLDTSASSELPK